MLATADHQPAGDELEYDLQGRLAAAGHWFWSTTPYGIPHPSLWKAPGYTAWMGLWYSLLGPDPDRVLLVQTLLGPVNVVLAWALARRLFGGRVALAAAAVVAVYPLAWQYEARLYSEALATPLTLVILLLALDRPQTRVTAAAIGAALGLLVLIRPSSGYVAAAVLAAFWTAMRGRRALVASALAIGIAALVVAPWTYRNHRLTGSLVPVSIQDITVAGVFNEEAANDPVRPWAFRAARRDVALIERGDPLPDDEFRRRLLRNALDYVREHPSSLPQAFFWNGLSRTWDVRRPARALEEVRFEGRSRKLTIAGLAMYYVLLPLALAGLLLERRRRALVVPILVLALSASLVYTSTSGTRFRSTLEPLIAILACSAVPNLGRGRGGG